MKNWFWIAVVIGVAFSGKVMEYWEDLASERRIARLHPVIREKVKAFLNEAARRGFFLRLTDGLRTIEEQNALYAQGRTKPGQMVTNAKGGQSYHNYGLAFDVVQIKDGKRLWENPDWSKIGQIGKSFGFAWGGDWSGFQDRPHFEYTNNKSYATLLAEVNSGKVDQNGYLTSIV